MEFENEIFFSKNYKLKDVDMENKIEFVKQLMDRINTFYLCPIKILNDSKEGFGACILLFNVIEVIAFIKYKKAHNIPLILNEILSKVGIDLNSAQLEIIKSNFRDGLTHEGIIKFQSYISYNTEKCVEFYGNKKYVINPLLLFKNLSLYVENEFYQFLNSQELEIFNPRMFKII